MSIKNSSPRPRAATANLVIQELDRETLVYNLTTNQAHCLNQTVASVWHACDGTRDLQAIKQSVEAAMRSSVPGELVTVALAELSRHNLLDESADDNLRSAARRSSDYQLPDQSRRTLLKQIGLSTAVALPVITSLVAPTAAHAASVATCTANNQCPSACCIESTCTAFNPAGAPDGGACNVDSDCRNNCCDNGVCSPACGVCFVQTV